jgi:hypothetical protein
VPTDHYRANACRERGLVQLRKLQPGVRKNGLVVENYLFIEADFLFPLGLNQFGTGPKSG